ncbi:Crp/Fnr family transcriptional regulator [Sphingobium yanoikuyae]|uniref:Crp/Fnr family transcriptional regulator n=1 Tax=Sphingobium yanoikuyae TaxID=13690 RepID=UPI00137702F1|nr:Crp/Fnr family transcriptional regulator [Sphingobium yanoikuyae]NBB39635.1 helix-turn-helix domain-containing protein [Sphingobium yanoikuyae]
MQNFSAQDTLIRKLTIHSQLSPAESAAISALPVRVTNYERGSFISRQTDFDRDAFVMLKGIACLQQTTRAGVRQLLTVYLSANVANVDAGFAEETQDVIAITPVEAALISLDALDQIFTEFPNVGTAFRREAAVELALLQSRLVSLGRCNARQRIARFACEMASRQKASGASQSQSIEWPWTQEELGDLTGLTAVHVNRTLKNLREDGVLTISRGSLQVTDWNAIELAAGLIRNS